SFEQVAKILKYDVKPVLNLASQGALPIIEKLVGTKDLYGLKSSGDFWQEKANAIASPELNSDFVNAAKSGNFKPLVRQIVSAAPSIGAMTYETILDPLLPIAAIGSETAGESYDKSLEKGIPATEAAVSAGFKGTVAAGMAFIPFHFLGKLYQPLVQQVGRQSALQIIKEAATHFGISGLGFQAGAQAQLAANATVDKITGEDPNAFDHYSDKAVSTGVMAGVTHLAMGGIPFGAILLKNGPEAFKTSRPGDPNEAIQAFHEQTAK